MPRPFGFTLPKPTLHSMIVDLLIDEFPAPEEAGRPYHVHYALDLLEGSMPAGAMSPGEELTDERKEEILAEIERTEQFHARCDPDQARVQQIRNKYDEWDGKGIATVVPAWRVLRRKQAAERLDEFRQENPADIADYDKWLTMPYWSADEAMPLLLGFEPRMAKGRSSGWGKLDLLNVTDHWKQVLLRDQETSSAMNKMPPGAWVAWAEHVGMPVNDPLVHTLKAAKAHFSWATFEEALRSVRNPEKPPAEGDSQQKSRASKPGPGATPKYDWEGATRAMGIHLYIAGEPATQAALVKFLRGWFIDQIGDAPSESSLKIKAGAYIRELQKANDEDDGQK